MNVVVFARNASWDLAKQVGVRYFMQMDDDYGGLYTTWLSSLEMVRIPVKATLDQALDAMIEFMDSTPTASIAMAQGGDFIGGGGKFCPSLKRKAMNTFLCSVDRRFDFFGRINEDTSTYVRLGATGQLFFTVLHLQVNQAQTQAQPGGLTEAYLDSGTYAKSFYTVMVAPSCVQVGEMGDHRSPHNRIHHKINWNRAVPKIAREVHRKAERATG
jgi:hypothetical protein